MGNLSLRLSEVLILWPYLKRAVIENRLLKYDTLAHTVTYTCIRFEVVHNRSIEFADCSQLCNYATH